MIELLKKIWNSITTFLFPTDYFAWQTIIYLGIFSLIMAWVARLSGALGLTESLIATAGWIFFAFGIGWFLEKNKVNFFGFPAAPWVSGAIVCIYFFGLLPFDNRWSAALMTWPLASVLILAIPQFLTWELKPKIPAPPVRQQLILWLLVAMLFSSWFQFYFRLQSWFDRYPTLLTDNFNNSGFVYRLSGEEDEPAPGVSLLTAAEAAVKDALDETPWPYVERWLLNLGEQLGRLRTVSDQALESSSERTLWQLEVRPRSLNQGYALDLLAVWSGPASDPEGYFFKKTCVIQPKDPPSGPIPENERPADPTPLAEVTCDLATPKTMGRPSAST